MPENVLLNLDSEPRFDAIHAADIEPALTQVMAEASQAIAAIKAQPQVTWLNTIEALTSITERVARIWGVVAHLNSVADTPELRDVYNRMMPEMTAFFTAISQDIELYERFKAIRAGSEYAQLSAAEQTKLAHDLRDFILSGAELPAEAQQELAALHSEAAQCSASFSQNVLDATDAFAMYFDDAAPLAGIPEDALAMFAAAAKAEERQGYKIGLQMPHYLAVMQYADNRQLREQLYHAYSTRASELGNPQWDNTDNINRILAMATREAQLLGFASYAELSLATKMADTPQQVLTFLHDLAARAKPYAQQDLDEVTAFAREQLALDTLAPWDVAYASEKLRQAKYAFSETEVKKYFPANRVLEGLFTLIDRLYGVRFIEKQVPVWHADVHYFELEKNGTIIGGVYMDLLHK